MLLPSYRPEIVTARFLMVSAIAVGIIFFISAVVDVPEEYKENVPKSIYLVTILAFNVAAEFQIILDNILERFLPIPEKIKLRISLQIILGILFLIVAHRVVMMLIGPQLVIAGARVGVVLGMIVGLLFVQIIANSLIVARFTKKYFDTQEEMADMKREKLRMDYNQLQDQLNPHFLFNNLSVLKSLIIYDPDVAVEFTENFTDVYRYVLQSKGKRLVKLADEMDFMKSYYALHKERMGDGIDIESRIPEKYLEKEVAPLTGQLLIENAVKHNVTSRETPLKIKVFIDNDYLVVSNSLNLRTSSYSTQTGLKNLVKRYEILTEKEVIVQYDEEHFEVKVPLL